MIYFDHNATTPLDPVARDAWLLASEKFIGNPSSPHRLGGRAEHALETARERLAQILGCHAHDLIWTSGATESSNGVLRHFTQRIDTDGEIWVSAIEHPCVFDTARILARGNVRLMPVSRAGVIDLDWLRSALKKNRPALVALMAANNETGVIQPWHEALMLCRESGTPFFCDAAQWLGKLPAHGLGACDYLSGCAHKFGGPRGVGFLRCEPRMTRLLIGGKQENGLRAGTENVAGVLAMLAALESRESGLQREETQPRLRWRESFERGLIVELPGLQITGLGADRLWNTVSVVMPVGAQRRWVSQLDKLGFAVSTGSACASGREEPSHVLTAMGLSPDESSRALRFSSGWESSEIDWQSLGDALSTTARSSGC